MDRRLSGVLIATGAALLVAALAGQESARHGASQYWKLARTSSPDIVRFTVERWNGGSHWSDNDDVPIARFRGLSQSTFDRGGRVTFEYVQDAGRLLCEGSFAWGRGSGSFTFAPDPGFSAELQRLGYTTPSEEQLFTMTMLGVSLEFARTAQEAGLHASTGQLVELRIHGVSSEYIREMHRAGYHSLSAQNYVDLRIHGVSPEFVSDLKRAGYELPAAQVTELRIHGVDSAFLRDLKDYGLQPHASELVDLRIHGVTAEYLHGLKNAGYGNLSSDRVSELRIHGVTTDFIRDARELGYSFTAQELIDLRIHGVDGDYLRRLRDSGMTNLNADQIQKLRIHGVD